MTRDFLDHLEDMLEFARKAGSFVGGMSWEAFQADEKTQFAVIRALEMIGEAARRIPPETQSRFSTIPWQRIIGMRNVLIHNYDNADPRIVFDTAKTFAPELIVNVQASIVEASKKS